MSELETNQAIELIKQGNLAEGAKVLSTVLKNEPDNEMAWLWMSACVPDREKKIYCLQKVIQINPFNASAKKGLDSFGVQVEPVIPTEMEQHEPADAVDNNFSYRDLTDALGERAPVNKEREPISAAPPVVEEALPVEEPKFSFDEIQKLEPEVFEETQAYQPETPMVVDAPESISISPPPTTSGEKAMMLEDFGFPEAADLPPAAPVADLQEAAPIEVPAASKIPESPRRRPRRKTNWLVVVVLLLLILLLGMVLIGRFVLGIF
jgi:hypothetical protein